MADSKNIRPKRATLGSLQPDIENLLELNDLSDADFAPASTTEKENFIQDRKSVSYWKDAWRRLRRNRVAMVALAVLVVLVLFAFVGPVIVPYTYNQQIRGSENLGLTHYALEDQERVSAEIAKRTASEHNTMTPDEAVAKARAEAEAKGEKLSRVEEAKIRAAAKTAAETKTEAGEAVSAESVAKELGIKTKLFGYSTSELQRMAKGEKVFPHVFGTDNFGRDTMVRVMMGARVSMIVGICAALLVLIIGALYGSVSGYCGGKVDTVMQRLVELIYSIPEVLVILLLSATLTPPLQAFQNAGNGPLNKLVTLLGPNLISMFIAFGLLYWVTMSRIIRGQILQLKSQEYVTAARALGASGGRIIKRHLLPNCVGQIITTTFLQIPSAIFLESFLSFLGVGVSAPLTSLGSMCSEALSGLSSYPHRMFIPAFILSVMILSLNLFGDGLRDALDPRLKK